MGVGLIRDARVEDAEAVAQLIDALGFDVLPNNIASRIEEFGRRGEPVLIADLGSIIGVLTWHIMPVLHRATSVGRISMLVVSEKQRGKGVGSKLVVEAERRIAESGCSLIEVTSNDRLVDAHKFYQSHGFVRTSVRLAKML
jgi:N-acetylglutamate synthase-like GNAT family acetyltransferase